MDIFATLRLEHSALRDLLDQLIDQSEPDQNTPHGPGVAEWPEAFHNLKIALVAHNRAEEAVFYEVLKSIPHRTELAETKTEEHKLAEELLEDLEEINPADNEWSEKLALLKNQIESHISEEETLVFSLVEHALGGDDAERLGAEFIQLSDEVRQGAAYHPRERSTLNPAGLDLKS